MSIDQTFQDAHVTVRPAHTNWGIVVLTVLTIIETARVLRRTKRPSSIRL